MKKYKFWEDMMESNKRVRGWIVRILSRAYPAGLEGSTLYKQIHDLGYEITRKEMAAALEYLLEDGFIALRKFEALGTKNELFSKFWKLTTKGIDLYEGSITDAGVDA